MRIQQAYTARIARKERADVRFGSMLAIHMLEAAVHKPKLQADFRHSM